MKNEKTIQMITKRIPIAGAIIPVGLMAYRWRKGQPIKSFGELISAAGTLSTLCVPVAGSIVSISIDTFLFGHDLYKSNRGNNSDFKQEKPVKDAQVELAFTLEEAYEYLGISPDNTKPTKNDVEAAYVLQMRACHSDKKNVETLPSSVTDELTECLNQVKSFIYEKNKWT